MGFCVSPCIPSIEHRGGGLREGTIYFGDETHFAGGEGTHSSERSSIHRKGVKKEGGGRSGRGVMELGNFSAKKKYEKPDRGGIKEKAF